MNCYACYACDRELLYQKEFTTRYKTMHLCSWCFPKAKPDEPEKKPQIDASFILT